MNATEDDTAELRADGLRAEDPPYPERRAGDRVRVRRLCDRHETTARAATCDHLTTEPDTCAPPLVVTIVEVIPASAPWHVPAYVCEWPHPHRGTARGTFRPHELMPED